MYKVKEITFQYSSTDFVILGSSQISLVLSGEGKLLLLRPSLRKLPAVVLVCFRRMLFLG